MALVQPLRYELPEDVRTRLHNSVAFYKKRPVLILSSGDREDRRNLDVTVTDLITGDRQQKVHSSDEDLDVQASRLGYVNLGDNRVLYAMRAPLRKGIQCLQSANVYLFDLDGQQHMSQNEYRMPEFGKMMLSDYPVFKEALLDLETGLRSQIAFGRKVAMRQTGQMIRLFYFNNCVGVLNRKQLSFAIPDRLAHYVPLLKQQGVTCFTS